jgi:hypothetical protein
MQRLDDIITTYEFDLPKQCEARQEMLYKEAVYGDFAIL